MENILQQLIDLLKNVAPEVWNVLVLQVSIQANQYLIWGIVIDIFAFLCIVAGLYNMFSYYQGDSLVIFGIVIAILSVGLWSARYGRIANPEYYAIQMLLEQLPK